MKHKRRIAVLRYLLMFFAVVSYADVTQAQASAPVTDAATTTAIKASDWISKIDQLVFFQEPHNLTQIIRK